MASWSAAKDSPALDIGDTIDFLPGYHDATVFRHAAIYGIRNGVVEAVFPVLARGVYS